MPPSPQSGDRRDDGSSGSAFNAALWTTLSDARDRGDTTCPHPVFDRSDFWSSFHLVHRAPVSQYDVLRRVISERRDLPGHVVCLALAGDGFHGQHGRAWAAEAGNLHLSVGLRCNLDAADTGLALTMLPAVAVMDALLRLDGSARRLKDPGIKWVNDILVDGRKLGGVLSSVRSQEGRITSAVLGIGLNVEHAPEVAPTPFTPAVTALNDHLRLPEDGLTMVLTHVLTALAERFEDLETRGPGPLLRDYRSFSLVLGRDCEVWPDEHADDPVRRGRVTAIGTDLALTMSDGPDPVTTGRLVLPEQPDIPIA
ncbi:MAG: biotin--[acetyl-CoA-carboxylase] ligase [Candidatus Krumholzibacteriota bacterium]